MKSVLYDLCWDCTKAGQAGMIQRYICFGYNVEEAVYAVGSLDGVGRSELITTDSLNKVFDALVVGDGDRTSRNYLKIWKAYCCRLSPVFCVRGDLLLPLNERKFFAEFSFESDFADAQCSQLSSC